MHGLVVITQMGRMGCRRDGGTAAAPRKQSSLTAQGVRAGLRQGGEPAVEGTGGARRRALQAVAVGEQGMHARCMVPRPDRKDKAMLGARVGWHTTIRIRYVIRHHPEISVQRFNKKRTELLAPGSEAPHARTPDPGARIGRVRGH
jgi:hypothetical protein